MKCSLDLLLLRVQSVLVGVTQPAASESVRCLRSAPDSVSVLPGHTVFMSFCGIHLPDF